MMQGVNINQNRIGIFHVNQPTTFLFLCFTIFWVVSSIPRYCRTQTAVVHLAGRWVRRIPYHTVRPVSVEWNGMENGIPAHSHSIHLALLHVTPTRKTQQQMTQISESTPRRSINIQSLFNGRNAKKTFLASKRRLEEERSIHLLGMPYPEKS